MKEIIINPSKSYSQRVILYSIFSGIRAIISNAYPMCNDTLATFKLLDSFGIEYKVKNGILDINPKNIVIPSDINVSESGTLCRMIIPLLLTKPCSVNINGEGSLLKRNLSLSETMYRVFTELYGVNITMNDEHLPISIDTTTKKDYIDSFKYYPFTGKDTSQYISGFIMAASLLDIDDVCIDIFDCPSLQYVLMTVDAISKFGVNITVKELTSTSCKIYIKTSQKPLAVSYNIEGDWSGAAGVIIYNILNNRTEEIKYKNLKYDSLQSDRKIIELLNKFCNIKIKKDGIVIKRNSSELTPFEFDTTLCPDLFPVVCALAGCINGESKISGLSRLTNKESNRGLVIFEEFKKYGIKTEIDGDCIKITGSDDEMKEPEYNSHNDHRIAMALIIIRKFYGLSIPTEDPCLNKSYNTFLQDTVYAE